MWFLEEEKYFVVLLLLLPVWGLVGFLLWWRNKKQIALGNTRYRSFILPTYSRFHWVWKAIWLSLCITCIAFALVNPRMGSKLKSVSRSGIDVVFLMDVSKSMLAEDIAPSRLDVSKLITQRSLELLASDKVGIVVYAGRAYAQLPLTTDFGSARMFLNQVNTEIVPSQGTDFDAAIQMAAGYFRDDSENATNRTIVLLSDGEGHEAMTQKSLTLLEEKDIKVFCVLVGTSEGAPIPQKKDGRVIGYKTDRSGNTVITKANTQTLKAIAERTQGALLDGNQINQTIQALEEGFTNIEKVESETEIFEDYDDQFPQFIGAALFFLLLYILSSSRKSKLWNMLSPTKIRE